MLSLDKVNFKYSNMNPWCVDEGITEDILNIDLTKDAALSCELELIPMKTFSRSEVSGW